MNNKTGTLPACLEMVGLFPCIDSLFHGVTSSENNLITSRTQYTKIFRPVAVYIGHKIPGGRRKCRIAIVYLYMFSF